MTDDDLSTSLRDRVDRATPAVPPSHDALAKRRDLRHRRRVVLVSAAAVAIVAAGSAVTLGRGGADVPTTTTSDPTGAVPQTLPPDPDDGVFRSPPTIVLEADGRRVRTLPGSSCWTYSQGDNSVTGCADMVATPDLDLPDVGSPAYVEFGFPITGATFRAQAAPVVNEKFPMVTCGSDQALTVTDLGNGRFRVDSGAPGFYRVTLVGHTAQGEVPVSFRWSMPNTACF